MKTAIIYYFSGTGNTLKACKLYQEYLGKHGVETRLCDMTSQDANEYNPRDFDLVGMAYPIHAFNAPYVVLDFAKKLQTVENKYFFVIKTSGEPLALNNISSVKLARIMGKKGYRLTFERHYVMPYNMIFRHSDQMAYRMLSALKTQVPKDVTALMNGEKSLLKKVPFGKIIAFVFRIEHLAMKVNGRHFKVDKSKCVGCKMCANNCPVGNIKIDEKGNFSFGKNCIMCARCSFNCPKNAISIGILNGWKVNGKYGFARTYNNEKDKHEGYCKKAYEEYFKKAEKTR